jgi:putative transposase
MAHEILLREGWKINKKPTQPLWRDEGLRRPQRCAKRRRPRVDSAVRQGAEYPNHGVWAIDFQFNETSDYRRLKLLNIVDEFTRESLAMEVDRSITADRLIDVVEGLVVVYWAPEHLRLDNGPELCS